MCQNFPVMSKKVSLTVHQFPGITLPLQTLQCDIMLVADLLLLILVLHSSGLGLEQIS
jgi:hypothetical protein